MMSSFDDFTEDSFFLDYKNSRPVIMIGVRDELRTVLRRINFLFGKPCKCSCDGLSAHAQLGKFWIFGNEAKRAGLRGMRRNIRFQFRRFFDKCSRGENSRCIIGKPCFLTEYAEILTLFVIGMAKCPCLFVAYFFKPFRE